MVVALSEDAPACNPHGLAVCARSWKLSAGYGCLSSNVVLVHQVVAGLPEGTPDAPEIQTLQGHELQGGPQMIQLRYRSHLMLGHLVTVSLAVHDISG